MVGEFYNGIYISRGSFFLSSQKEYLQLLDNDFQCYRPGLVSFQKRMTYALLRQTPVPVLVHVIEIDKESY
jgi:hypothetical protein